MTYKINDVALVTQPTRGTWGIRDSLGLTGDGRAILPAHRVFEMSWDTLDPSGLHQMVSAWQDQDITGTSSVDLPVMGRAPYGFSTFSGVFVEEPEMGSYFEGHYLNVVVRVSRVAILDI